MPQSDWLLPWQLPTYAASSAGSVIYKPCVELSDSEYGDIEAMTPITSEDEETEEEDFREGSRSTFQIYTKQVH